MCLVLAPASGHISGLRRASSLLVTRPNRARLAFQNSWAQDERWPEDCVNPTPFHPTILANLLAKEMILNYS